MIQAPYKIIVSPIDGKQYNDTKTVGDVELKICNSIEEAIDVQRVGVVRSLPIGYQGDVILGDLVIIHHNVFRIMFDHKGVARQSDNHIKDDLFGVTLDMIYMVIRDGQYIATDDNVFVEPIVEDSFWHGKKELENEGIAKYVNNNLQKQGVPNGSKIAFKNGSKYEFNILGQRLWMMKSRRIVAHVN
jgi:hypothetical protein